MSKWRIIYLLCVAALAAFIVGILFMDIPDSSGADAPAPEEDAVVVQIIPEPESIVKKSLIISTVLATFIRRRLRVRFLLATI